MDKKQKEIFLAAWREKVQSLAHEHGLSEEDAYLMAAYVAAEQMIDTQEIKTGSSLEALARLAETIELLRKTRSDQG